MIALVIVDVVAVRQKNKFLRISGSTKETKRRSDGNRTQKNFQQRITTLVITVLIQGRKVTALKTRRAARERYLLNTSRHTPTDDELRRREK